MNRAILKDRLLRWARPIYPLIKVGYHLYLRISTAGRRPLLLFLMTKVGSTTMARSLRAAAPDLFIYHVHFLTKEWTTKRWARRIGKPLLQSLYLQGELQRCPSGRWDVISMVREPVARNISAFFQTMHALHPDVYSRVVSGNAAISDLCDLFLRSFRHDLLSTWFDQEFKSVLGADIFATRFPREKGYGIYEFERARVLLLRTEDLDNCAAEAMHQFLGIEQFTLRNANVGKEKEYGAAYDLFRQRLRVPEHLLNRLYSSKYARHFYSESEILRFRRRWSG